MVDLIVFRLEAGISTYPFLPLLMNLFEICAEKFIIVFPELHRRRVMVDQLYPPGQLRVLPNGPLQPFHALHPGFVIVQAQADLSNVRMIAQELEHGAGCGSTQGNIMAVLPVAPELFHQRSQGKGVNGAFRHSQPGTLQVGG